MVPWIRDSCKLGKTGAQRSCQQLQVLLGKCFIKGGGNGKEWETGSPGKSNMPWDDYPVSEASTITGGKLRHQSQEHIIWVNEVTGGKIRFI